MASATRKPPALPLSLTLPLTSSSLLPPQIFNAFCSRKSLQPGAVRFLFDGQRINPHQTPKEVRVPSRLRSSSRSSPARKTVFRAPGANFGSCPRLLTCLHPVLSQPAARHGGRRFHRRNDGAGRRPLRRQSPNRANVNDCVVIRRRDKLDFRKKRRAPPPLSLLIARGDRRHRYPSNSISPHISTETPPDQSSPASPVACGTRPWEAAYSPRRVARLHPDAPPDRPPPFALPLTAPRDSLSASIAEAPPSGLTSDVKMASITASTRFGGHAHAPARPVVSTRTSRVRAEDANAPGPAGGGGAAIFGMFPAPGGALGSCGISFAAAASLAGRWVASAVSAAPSRASPAAAAVSPRSPTYCGGAQRRLLLGNRRAVSREVLRMRERRRAQTHERVPRHQSRYDSRGGVRPAPGLAERFVSSSFRRAASRRATRAIVRR